jgi:competence CoiA-like predicted nuclease
MYAVNQDGVKCLPSKEGEFYCPCCESKVVAKMGSIKIHHWAHLSSEIYCDSRPMSEWHLEWQSHFPPEMVEIYVNNKRRADVLLPNKMAIEFQNSTISIEDVLARNQHHKDGIIWVHNYIEQTINKQFFNKKEIKKGLYRALWKNPTHLFDRQRIRGEDIYFQFSENTLGKICWVDYSTKPYTSFSFYLTTKKEFLSNFNLQAI